MRRQGLLAVLGWTDLMGDDDVDKAGGTSDAEKVKVEHLWRL
jgi:hypothetical protein